METLKYLISFFLKIALAFFILALVLGLVSLLFPSFSPSQILKSLGGSKKEKSDWLPAPKRYTGLRLDGKGSDVQNNVYVPNAAFVSAPAFNGYGLGTKNQNYSTYNYVVYSTTNQPTISNGGDSSLTQFTATQRAMYIRNVSLYEGSRVYNGLWFVGEAKSIMFRDGAFPIIIVNREGVVLGVSKAVASSKWSTPGWVRFEAKIEHQIQGSSAPCTMIFEEALTEGERKSRQPVRVPLGVKCN